MALECEKMTQNVQRYDFGYSGQNDPLKQIKTAYFSYKPINLTKITFELVLSEKYFRPTLKSGPMTSF